jgi:hypothetical protein
LKAEGVKPSSLEKGAAEEAAPSEATDHELESSARGRRPYDIWELYKAKFYLMLDDDDVAPHININVSHYAGRLLTWGSINNFREVPAPSTMRGYVTEWKALWPQLKAARNEGNRADDDDSAKGKNPDNKSAKDKSVKDKSVKDKSVKDKSVSADT